MSEENSRTIQVVVRAEDEVGEVKQMIAEKEGIPVENQKMVFSGKYLENAKALGRYGVMKESTIHLILHQY